MAGIINYYKTPVVRGVALEALEADNESQFLSAISNRGFCILLDRRQLLLLAVSEHNAVKCANALLLPTSALPLRLDVNNPTAFGRFPLHDAAFFGRPGIVELFLHHGARTSTRCESDNLFYDKEFPLNLALPGLCQQRELLEWTPKQSIFKLITLLCLPRMQNRLETISLLAWTTEETCSEFLSYARDGKLAELAALLLVAHEKLSHCIETIKSSVLEIQNAWLTSVDKKEELLQMLRLFDVFEWAGDAPEAYVKQDKTDVDKLKPMQDVRHLLLEAGFPLNDSRTDWSDYQWYATCCKPCPPTEGRDKAPDIGMEHYSSSSYRWTEDIEAVKSSTRLHVERKIKPVASLQTELWTPTLLLQEIPHVPITESQRGGILGLNFLCGVGGNEKNMVLTPISVLKRVIAPGEGDLVQALYTDHDGKFLSSITNWGFCILYDRHQKLLIDVCSYNSVKCASALLKTELPLQFDINRPTASGWFPLHVAAFLGRPSITELFLYHGAQTDIRCKSDDPNHNERLPLNLALLGLCRRREFAEWTFKQSIFKLLTVLCLPRMQNQLETVCLLAWTTKETESEFLSYARDGKLAELATLLLVSQEKLSQSIEAIKSSVPEIQSAFLTSENKKEELSQMLRLFDVFGCAGNAFEAYVKQDKTNVNKVKTMQDVKKLLLEAGFSEENSNTDLSVYKWFKAEDIYNFRPTDTLIKRFQNSIMGLLSEGTFKYDAGPPTEGRKKAADIGMEHFSMSHYRWTEDTEAVKSSTKLDMKRHKKKYTSMQNEPWNSTSYPEKISLFSNMKRRKGIFGFNFPYGVGGDEKNRVVRACHSVRNVSSNKLLVSSIVSGMKRVVKCK